MLARRSLALLMALVFAPGAAASLGAQAQPAEPWVLEDPAGDVAPAVAGQAAPGAPGTSPEAIDYADLRRIEILDPHEGTIVVRIAIEGTWRDHQGGFGATTVVRREAEHRLVFQVEGGNMWAHLLIESQSDSTYAGDALAVRYVRLYGFQGASVEAEACSRNGITMPWAILASGELEVRIPKARLLSGFSFFGADLECSRPDALVPGTQLRGIYAWAHVQQYGTYGDHVRFADRAPGQGDASPYALAFGTPATDLGVYVRGYGAEAEAWNRVPMLVSNSADRPRTLHLIPILEAGATGWEVRPTPRITLDARTSVNATLWVRAPAFDASAPPVVQGALRAVVEEEPDVVGLGTFEIGAGIGMDAGFDVYYFHRKEGNPGSQAYLSRLREDPAAVAGDITVNSGFGNLLARELRVTTTAEDAAPVPHNVRFLLNESVTAHLVVMAPHDATNARYTIAVEAGTTNIARENGRLDIVEGRNEMDVDLPFSAFHDVRGLERSDRRIEFDLDLRYRVEQDVTGGTRDGFLLKPVDSYLRIPWEREREIVPGPEDARVALTIARNPYQELNPGGRVAFPFFVFNEEDNRTVTVWLQAGETPEGWKVSFKPGDRLRLDAHDRTTWGVEITAPKDVPELTRASVEVVASVDGVPVSNLWYDLLVVTDVEHADERFQADGDARAREVPMPGLAFVLAAAAVGLILRRRR